MFLFNNSFNYVENLLLSFPCPILHAFVKKLANSFSSSLVRNELGPGFFPCFTLPEILSFKVVLALHAQELPYLLPFHLISQPPWQQSLPFRPTIYAFSWRYLSQSH